MTIFKSNGKMTICKRPKYTEKPYKVCKGENGKSYVERNTAYSCYLNVSDGNTKTGPAVNLNMPIEYTCNHSCECYKLKNAMRKMVVITIRTTKRCIVKT